MYRCFTNHNDDKVTYDKKIITINSNLFFSLALYIILFILFFSPLTFAFFCYFILKLNFSFAVIFMQIYGASFVAPSIYSFSVDIYLNHNAAFAYFFFGYLPIYRVRKRTNKIVNSKMRQMKLFEFLQFLLPIRMNILPLLN